jgi:glyoxylase I family protein
MKIHHLAIQVREIERVLPFYRDVLGMREIRQQAHAVWLDAGGVILMLERCTGDLALAPWTSDRPGFHLVAFALTASEREEMRARLFAAGHAIEHETGFTLYTRDPEGNRLGFSHYPEPRR